METNPDVTEEECSALEALQDELTESTGKRNELRSQLPNNANEHEDQARKVDELEQKLYLKKLDVRDQMLMRNFADIYNHLTGKPLQVLPVSHVGYQEHLDGTANTRKPYLPIEETNIPKFRDVLCKEHGDAEVETFKSHLQKEKKYAQQLLICLDPENLPSRDSVLAIFNGQITVSLVEEHNKLQRSLDVIRSELGKIFELEWQEHIEKKMEVYRKGNGGTIGACIKKKGVHKPSKQPEIRMSKDFVEDVPAWLKLSVKSLQEAIAAASSSAIEKVRGHIRDLRSRLEQSDRSGAIDLDMILRYFESGELACITDITKCSDQYEENVHFAITKSTADRVYNAGDSASAFVEYMDPIYEACYKAFPPKWKGRGSVTNSRLIFIQEALLRRPGPFSKLSKDIVDRLGNARMVWSGAVDQRVQKMLNKLKNVLLNSFDGKRMSVDERAKIAPSLRSLAKKLISEIDEMLAKYKSEEAKSKERKPEERLFVAQ